MLSFFNAYLCQRNFGKKLKVYCKYFKSLTILHITIFLNLNFFFFIVDYEVEPIEFEYKDDPLLDQDTDDENV